MRTNRLLGCSLLLMVILFLIVLFRPSVFLLDQGGKATAVPHLGERLKWVSASEFTIHFNLGNSPCNAVDIPSHKVGDAWEASCIVIRVLKVGHNFTYNTTPVQTNGENGLEVRSCPGCVFGSSEIGNEVVRVHAAAILPLIHSDGSAYIGCTAGSPVEVSPLNIQPGAENGYVVTWGLISNQNDFSLDFIGNKPPRDNCKWPLNSANNSCAFPATSTDYPFKYKVTVTGCTPTDDNNPPKVVAP